MVELIGGMYAVEWLNVATDVTVADDDIKGGRRKFLAPFEGQAVLHLKAR